MKTIMTFIFSILIIGSAYAADDAGKTFRKAADDISAISSKLKNKTVAVIPFEALGFSDSHYGSISTAKFSAALSEKGSLTLVEREKLDSIMREKELSMIGIIESRDAQKIGNILSVDAVITGSLYRTEKGAEITVKAIDTKSGKIIRVVSYSYSYHDSGKKNKASSPFHGVWKVTSTAPYLLEMDMKYEKIELRDDGSFSLFLVNNSDTFVEIRGRYRIEKNSIDYRPMQMFFDEKPVAFKKLTRVLEGTIYLNRGLLFFNYTSMGKGSRSRLDAMDKYYRCTAEKIK